MLGGVKNLKRHIQTDSEFKHHTHQSNSDPFLFIPLQTTSYKLASILLEQIDIWSSKIRNSGHYPLTLSYLSSLFLPIQKSLEYTPVKVTKNKRLSLMNVKKGDQKERGCWPGFSPWSNPSPPNFSLLCVPVPVPSDHHGSIQHTILSSKRTVRL